MGGGMKTFFSAGGLIAAVGVLAADVEEGGSRRIEFREPAKTIYHIEPETAVQAEDIGRFALHFSKDWTEARIDGTTNRVELGSRVVLQLQHGFQLDDLIEDSNLILSRTINANLFILQSLDSSTAIDAAEVLATKSGVVSSYPVMRRAYQRHDLFAKAPSDERFRDQWHLDNRGRDHNRVGPDLNVRAAWPITMGEDVVVAVADDGFQLDHPDLKSRAFGPHFNFFRGISSGGPAYSEANHATAVAGLIAAETGNDLGVVGVAPEARLASWVIFGTSFRGGDSIASDEELMDMFQFATDRVAVQNHSWGSVSLAPLALDALSDAGIEAAVSEGRGGKGVVMVRAAGNEREDLTNANDDAFGSDPRVVAVAAIRKDGRATSYSSPGACLLVAAPSGDLIDTDGDGFSEDGDPEAPDVLTTDRTGRNGFNTDSGEGGDVTEFNGTSASTPQIAGVAALILSANPSLNYRDVQQILIHSARHYDLEDPDSRLNGAGFRVSHNIGFGIPDAGLAVRLAKNWTSRPPVTTLNFTSGVRKTIPDDALRLIINGEDVGASLASIRTLPSLGLHADDATGELPIVFVGTANAEITEDLHGKAALIRRGGSFFSDKIARAARAGAEFAIIYNNIGTTEIQFMGGTTFVPIPAASIGRSDGEALRAWLETHSDATAKIQLTPAVYRFSVRGALSCEHIGVRLDTTHSRRSDVRVTLVSPAGTRSVMQAINVDSSAGPRDWTYWSTQHFYESSVGEWRVEVSDERNSTVRSFRQTSPATGSVSSVQLILKGVVIRDTDADGLDDLWELASFESLGFGPADDPDNDGYNNAREQVLGTDPMIVANSFRLDYAELQPGFQRFSWPAKDGVDYVIESSPDYGIPFRQTGSVSGRFPVTEFVLPTPAAESPSFFRVRQLSTD